jgi:hypothetical protein
MFRDASCVVIGISELIFAVHALQRNLALLCRILSCKSVQLSGFGGENSIVLRLCFLGSSQESS